jgi:hypothetical protein
MPVLVDSSARKRRGCVVSANCAKLNGREVAHDDNHFDELAKLEA